MRVAPPTRRALLGDARAQALPGRSKVVQLGVVEIREKSRPDAGEVRRACFREPGAARLGELCVEDAAIVGTRLPDDVPRPLEPVDEARDAALAEQHRRREVAHPQALVGRVGEVEEHLVVRERQPVRLLQLTVVQLLDVLYLHLQI